MKAVKEFTIRKSENCSGSLLEGNMCCASGRFLLACQVPKKDIQGLGVVPSKMKNKIAKLYHTTYETVSSMFDNVYGINDRKKDSWERRLKKFRAEFKEIGVRVNLKD